MENSVLVSVCVMTYNSSAYVLETLESVYRQTYPDIELIISDDASSDNTMQICRNWITSQRKTRFRNVILLSVPTNTGVPANANRSVRAARGKWIKHIAGDDALLPDCIENCVTFVSQNPHIRICQSVIRKYAGTLEEAYFMGSARPRKKMTDPSLSAAGQYRLLLMGSWVLTPSVFIRKELLEETGCYDESIPLCEDWPMWLKITKRGNKIYFMDKETVQYRINTFSISHRKSHQFISDRQYEVLSSVYAGYLAGHLPFFLDMEKRYSMALYLWLQKHKLNDTSRKLYFFVFKLLYFPLTIVTWIRYIYLTGWRSIFKETWPIVRRRIKAHMLKD